MKEDFENSSLDFTYIYDISGGNEVFVINLLTIVEKNLKEYPVLFADHFKKGEIKQVSEVAHKFKSCISYLGHEDFNLVLDNIELYSIENPEIDLQKAIEIVAEFSKDALVEITQKIAEFKKD